MARGTRAVLFYRGRRSGSPDGLAWYRSPLPGASAASRSYDPFTVKTRLAVLTPVLLSVFACGSSLDNPVTSAVKTRPRLARFGETGTFEPSLTWWNEDLSRLFAHR